MKSKRLSDGVTALMDSHRDDRKKQEMKRVLILCGLISMCLLPPTLTYAQQQNDPLWVKRLA
ncbi:MAG: hypothetical protein NT023_11665, partial [Armatimonadetes bacterium]|nr:hypothetical protein [Armatimonadota bacterium]